MSPAASATSSASAASSPAERFKVEVRYANGNREVFDGGAGAPGSLAEARRMVQMRTTVGDDNAMMTGRQMYEELTDRHGSPEEASRWLNERGVKGLRYLDQGSRAAGEGSYNFVVFDDAAIDVIETYYQGAARPRIGQGEARYVERADGRYVALADGSDRLGEITVEIAAAIGREAAPIRLPEGDARFGEAHIEAQRGEAIRAAGYADAAEMVADVAAGFTRVVEGHSGRLFLVKPNGRDRALVVVELRAGEGGGAYSVVSAGLFRPGYLKGRRVLWEGERRSPFAADEDDPLQRGGQSSKERLDQEAAAGNAPAGAVPGASPGVVGLDARAAPRAAVEIGADFRRIILGARSDKTSFLHESAHVFLWLLRELGADAEAAPRIRQDWETIRDFLGAADDAPLTRDQHEKLASTFERYLAEGKAPAPELEGAFARMKDWFLSVYRSLRDIAPDIAPDVRAVFDKLLADGVEAGRARFAAEVPGTPGTGPGAGSAPAALPDPPASARAATVAEIAAEHGVDLEGGHDAEPALAQLADDGGLLDAEKAELAAADALVARASAYERAYAAAAACLSRVP